MFETALKKAHCLLLLFLLRKSDASISECTVKGRQLIKMGGSFKGAHLDVRRRLFKPISLLSKIAPLSPQYVLEECDEEAS